MFNVFKRNVKQAIDSDRVIVAAWTDTHGGSELGLLRPGTVLYRDDEQGNPVPWTPDLTPVQEWLWNCLEKDIAEVERIADGCPLAVIHVGDATHGNKHPDMLVSGRISDQNDMAVYSMARWFELDNLVSYRLLQGTCAHNLQHGSAEIQISKLLAALFPSVKVQFSRHYLIDARGVSLDVAHHGPGTGIRQWTRGNVARLYALSIMAEHIERGLPPPRVILRGHVHGLAWKTVRRTIAGQVYETEMIIVPPYCGLNDFGNQVTRSLWMLTVGMIVLVIERGKLVDVIPLWREEDLRTREELF